MSHFTIDLSDSARSFVEDQVAKGNFASATEYIASLVEAARRRAAVERVDQLLLEGLESGPVEEVTAEWWEQTKAEWLSKRSSPPQP